MTYRQQVRAHLTALTGPPSDAWRDRFLTDTRKMVDAEMSKTGRKAFRVRKLLSGGFDHVDPATVAAAERQAATLVKDVSDSVIEAIRQAIVQSNRAELDRDATRALIRQVVGPTPRDAAIISRVFSNTYRDELAAGASPSQSVLAAQPSAAAAREVAIRRRAKVIERTETRRAQQLGRREGWRQAHAQGLFPNDAKRVWLTSDPCKICEPMDNEKVGWNEPFDGLGDPPAHPNCRCYTILEIP